MSPLLEQEPHMKGTLSSTCEPPRVQNCTHNTWWRGQRGCHQRLGECGENMSCHLWDIHPAPWRDSLYLSTLSFMHGRCSPGHSKLPSINTWVEAHSDACHEEGERRWLDITSVLFVCVGFVSAVLTCLPRSLPSNEGTSRSYVTEQSCCSNP